MLYKSLITISLKDKDIVRYEHTTLFVNSLHTLSANSWTPDIVCGHCLLDNVSQLDEFNNKQI